MIISVDISISQNPTVLYDKHSTRNRQDPPQPDKKDL